MPVERKWEIYSICSEYGVVIIEDDPYYYLQYPDATGAATCMMPVQHAWMCLILCLAMLPTLVHCDRAAFSSPLASSALV